MFFFLQPYIHRYLGKSRSRKSDSSQLGSGPIASFLKAIGVGAYRLLKPQLKKTAVSIARRGGEALIDYTTKKIRPKTKKNKSGKKTKVSSKKKTQKGRGVSKKHKNIKKNTCTISKTKPPREIRKKVKNKKTKLRDLFNDG